MDLSKQKKLVERLSEHTIKNMVTWEQSINSGIYQATVGNNTIRIKTTPHVNGVDVILTLHNSNGDVVEEFSDMDLNKDAERVSEDGKTWYKLMNDLYESARRKALGADQVLDEIIADLEEDIPF